MSQQTQTTRPYRVTFILDLRESEEDAPTVLNELAETLSSLDAAVAEQRDLGLREFARAADPRFTQGHYLQLKAEAPPEMPAQLKRKLRLDGRIDRIFVESL